MQDDLSQPSDLYRQGRQMMNEGKLDDAVALFYQSYEQGCGFCTIRTACSGVSSGRHCQSLVNAELKAQNERSSFLTDKSSGSFGGVMFCPGCGLSEERSVQFCRSCGTDLGTVRESLAQPDAAVNSVALAREEIARAVAARIQTGEWWHLGAMVPEVEKLFESPQERRLRLLRKEEAARLRRVRAGVITAASGLGLILLFVLLSIGKPDLLLLAGPALVVLLIGLGIVLNGLIFTVRKQSRALPGDPDQDPAGLSRGILAATPGPTARPSFQPSSVTDQTTRHLSSELTNKSNGTGS